MKGARSFSRNTLPLCRTTYSNDRSLLYINHKDSTHFQVVTSCRLCSQDLVFLCDIFSVHKKIQLVCAHHKNNKLDITICLWKRKLVNAFFAHGIIVWPHHRLLLMNHQTHQRRHRHRQHRRILVRPILRHCSTVAANTGRSNNSTKTTPPSTICRHLITCNHHMLHICINHRRTICHRCRHCSLHSRTLTKNVPAWWPKRHKWRR